MSSSLTAGVLALFLSSASCLARGAHGMHRGLTATEHTLFQGKRGTCFPTVAHSILLHARARISRSSSSSSVVVGLRHRSSSSSSSGGGGGGGGPASRGSPLQHRSWLRVSGQRPSVGPCAAFSSTSSGGGQGKAGDGRGSGGREKGGPGSSSSSKEPAWLSRLQHHYHRHRHRAAATRERLVRRLEASRDALRDPATVASRADRLQQLLARRLLRRTRPHHRRHLPPRLLLLLPPPAMNVARDVIVARGADGSLHATDFYVTFKPVSGIYKWLVSRPALANLRLTTPRGGTDTAATIAASAPSLSARQQQQRQAALTGGEAAGPANQFTQTLLSSIGFTEQAGPNGAVADAAAATSGSVPSSPCSSSTSSSYDSDAERAGDGEGGASSGSSIPTSTAMARSIEMAALAQQQQQQEASTQAQAQAGEEQAPPSPPAREGVEVYVQGKLAPALEMVVDERGHCAFASTGTPRPSPEALGSLSLTPGPNPVEFVYRNPYGEVTVTATFHLWEHNDTLIVSDIDGTITKSDVQGYVETVHLGRFEHTHSGVCRLYSCLDDTHGVRLVYLTSRPISLLEATRNYIENCQQDGHRLPQGPIFTSTESLTRVLYKELIQKTIRHFKAQTLRDIAAVFERAGRGVTSRPCFAAGFGNKLADALAYAEVGVPKDAIFIINPLSDIVIHAHQEEEEEEEEGQGNGLMPPQSPASDSGGNASASAGGYYRGRFREIRRQLSNSLMAAAASLPSSSSSSSSPSAASPPVDGSSKAAAEAEAARVIGPVKRMTMSRGGGGSIDGPEDLEKQLEGDEEAMAATAAATGPAPVFLSYADERLLRRLELALAHDRAKAARGGGGGLRSPRPPASALTGKQPQSHAAAAATSGDENA